MLNLVLLAVLVFVLAAGAAGSVTLMTHHTDQAAACEVGSC
jgi:hypothetical protein